MECRRSVTVITAPIAEPITLAEAKLHLRETQTAQDDLITALIKAVRGYAENYTRRAIMTQTLELRMSSFGHPKHVIQLPRPPLQYVESVKYVDANGWVQTVSADTYQYSNTSTPGELAPVYGAWWPTTELGAEVLDAVRIRYVAGYAEVGSPIGVDPANGVPDDIKHWMKARVAQLYEYREAVVPGTLMNVPRDYVDGLLDRHRVNIFGS